MGKNKAGKTTKTFQAEILCKEFPRLKDYLWITHRIFNESIPFVIRYMRYMEKGKKGPITRRFNPEIAEKFKAVYYDMMGLPYKGIVELSGVDKKKRQGRSQSAHAWVEAITFSAKSKKSEESKNKNIHPDIRKLILELRKAEAWLFDRDEVFSFDGDDWGFVRSVIDTAARRILNYEQNTDTHKKKGEEIRGEFEEWKNKPSTHYPEFELIRKEFEDYENQRTVEVEKNTGNKPKEPVKIDGAMAREWREIHRRLQENPSNNPNTIIKSFQQENPDEIGDINFFQWLATCKHLWSFVQTMVDYNWYLLKEKQYSEHIRFTYPKPEGSSEWFAFSVSSPGHMYNLISLDPGVIELAVFVPEEDVERLTKCGLVVAKRGKTKTDLQSIQDTKEFLTSPISLNSYLVPTEKIPIEARDFFKTSPPLDMNRFVHVIIRFDFAIDRRLTTHYSRVKEFVPTHKEKTTSKKSGAPHDKVVPATCLFDRSPMSNKERRKNLNQQDWVRAWFQGARLRFLKQKPYLDFTVEMEGALKPELKMISSEAEIEEGIQEQTKAKKKTKKIPEGFITVAVDLGQRFTAALTVMQKGNGKLFGPIAAHFLKLPGIELPSIDVHQYTMKDLRKKTANALKKRFGSNAIVRLARGQDFAIKLREHINNMKKDRCKKAAHLIVKFAKNNNAHCILFENLKGYNPDQELGHRVNARLMTWNRREMVEWVKSLAKPWGKSVYEFIWPTYTSQMCCYCGSIGTRFSRITKEQALRDLPADKGGKRYRGRPLGLKEGIYQVIRGGKLFCCSNPECPSRKCYDTCDKKKKGKPHNHYGIRNADFNASVNLHKRFYGDTKGHDMLAKFTIGGLFKTYKSTKIEGKRFWFYKGKEVGSTDFFRQIEKEVQDYLNLHYKQEGVLPAGWKGI